MSRYFFADRKYRGDHFNQSRVTSIDLQVISWPERVVPGLIMSSPLVDQVLLVGQAPERCLISEHDQKVFRNEQSQSNLKKSPYI